MKNTCRILASALCASLLFAVCGAARAATYAKKLDITAAGVPENVTLTDFPLLVRLSGSIDGFSYQDFLGTGGSDIRFEDASGNPLAYDVDTWNELGESLIWVKVPSLQKDSVVTMQFGSTAPDANDPTNVWSNYAGVWHGNPSAPGASTSVDSTINARVATPSAAFPGFGLSSSLAEHLGSAWTNYTSAVGTKVQLGSGADNPLASLTSLSQFAASAWVKSSSTGPDFRLFSSKSVASGKGFEFMTVSSGAKIMLRGDGNDGNKTLSWTGGYTAIKSQNWTHMACVFDDTAGKVFVNGQSSSATVAKPTENAGLAASGYGSDSGNNRYNPILGYLDEIRIYNGVPSDEYLQAEYAQVVTAGYTTFGSVRNASADAAEIADAPTVTRNANGTYTIAGTVSGVSGVTYDIGVKLGGATVWSESWTASAGSLERAVSWTTDGNVAAGTYSASIVATAPSGSVATRASASNFLVGDISAAKVADAYEEGLVAGSFALSRPGDATLPLTVSYEVSSETAVAGSAYVAVSGTAEFAAGSSTATVGIVPINNQYLVADATITLAILAGDFYGVSQSAGSASLTLYDYTPPAGYNVWIARDAGNASNGSNWSLGRAPVATDHILLGAWSTRTLTWDAAATNEVASWTQNSDFNAQVIFNTTYEGADVDAGFNLLKVAGNVTLEGGYWVHPNQGDLRTDDASNERYRIAVSVGGDMTIGSGATISGQARGRYSYADGWYGLAMYGGYAISSTNNAYAAASTLIWPPFGSILEPVSTGRGAAGGSDSAEKFGRGGGAVWLDVAGDFSLEGKITVNGDAYSYRGGSGGSVFIRAGNISIANSGKIEANGGAATKTDGASAAGSGGRIALVASGTITAAAASIECNGSRSGDIHHISSDLYNAAAGTVWLQSGSSKTLLVRNNLDNNDIARNIRAFTPIPADDDAAAAKAAFNGATLRLAEHSRVRLVAAQRFATLQVQTSSTTLAHLDLCGNRLTVSQIVDESGNVIATRGTYTLAEALARGWTWFEDSSATLNTEGTAVETAGAGSLVVGASGFSIILR